MMKTLGSFKLHKLHKQQGAVLLEALIAVLIFSFGILAISGLQGAMMKNTADATYRAEASYVVQQYMGSLLANPFGYGQGATQPVPTLPNGWLCTKAVSNGRLRLKVTWNTPQGNDPCVREATVADEHQYVAITSIFTARQ
ncbi:MAG: prepilin-type cleavage/methylation domain-containing protein [Methylotenera sp.]